jgi:tripartite-type tricarboxylate transporter receptor subunit TctC
MSIRERILGCIVVVLGTIVTPIFAQQYPAKPVKVVVPYAPGGGTDAMARVLANQLSGATGATFVVENKGGADGTIGADQVAKSPNDGHTVLIVPGVSFVLNQVTFKSLPYNVLDDFEPVSMFARGPMVLLASTSVPAESMAELVALLKANPRKYSYAGTDPFTYLTTEMILQGTGTSVLHVPYKGGGPGLLAVVGGHTDLMVSSLAPALPQIRAGKVKALAVTTKTRSPSLPNVPTIAETVIPDFDLATWFGMLAPKGTPKSVVAYLNDAVNKAVEGAEVKKSLGTLGVDGVRTNPEQVGVVLRAELDKFRKAAKDTNLPTQ